MKTVSAEFLAKAQGDLATARREQAVRVQPNHDAVCFHCQQAIEKLMKALLCERGVEFPRTHDLLLLLKLLLESGVEWSPASADLAMLMPGSVEGRYPGLTADAEDARLALDACERLWATLRPLLPG